MIGTLLPALPPVRKPRVKYLGSKQLLNGVNSWVDAPMGTPSSDRIICCCMTYMKHSDAQVNAFTLGGVSRTYSQIGWNQWCGGARFYAQFPTGDKATITTTVTAGIQSKIMHLFAVYDYTNPVPVSVDEETTSLNYTRQYTLTKSGVIISTMTAEQTGVNFTWTGIDEKFEYNGAPRGSHTAACRFFHSPGVKDVNIVSTGSGFRRLLSYIWS